MTTAQRLPRDPAIEPPVLSVGWHTDGTITPLRQDAARGASSPTHEIVPVPERIMHVLALPDLEQIALQHNPTLVAAQARIDAAEGQWVQAGLYPNPVIGYHATEVGNLETAGQQGGFVRQRIITGGKRHLDRATADRAVQEAEYLFVVQKERVLSDVRLRFYDALVAQRQLELTTELAGISDNLVRASRQLLDARQVSETVLLQSEIEAESIQVLQNNASNEHIESWRRLAAVIGLPSMDMMPLEGNLDATLPRYSWEKCYELAVRKHPEISAAATRVEQAQFAVKRAYRERIPDIDILVSVRHNNVTSYDVANVQVGIPIPVFDANQGNIQRAQAELIVAEQSVQTLELNLQDRLAVAYRRYANARQEAERYAERILPRARRALDIVTGGYEKGQVDYLDLITTQRTFIRANLTYLSAIAEVRRSATIIEGQLLSESLAERRRR